MTLLAHRISGGVLTVTLEGVDSPALALFVAGQEVGALNRDADPVSTAISYSGPLPVEVLNDGLTILSVLRPGELDPLAQIPVAMGDILTEDQAVEMANLRAELELVKAALRRMHKR